MNLINNIRVTNAAHRDADLNLFMPDEAIDRLVGKGLPIDLDRASDRKLSRDTVELEGGELRDRLTQIDHELAGRSTLGQRCIVGLLMVVAHVVDARRLVELLLRPAAWALVAAFVLGTAARACSSTSSGAGRSAPAPTAAMPVPTAAVAHDGVRANVHTDLLFPFVLGHFSLAIYLYRRANPPFRDPRVRGRVRRPAPVPERDGRAP